MPMYDYECNTCGHVFESLEKLDTHWVDCPRCECMSYRITPTKAPAGKVVGGLFVGQP